MNHAFNLDTGKRGNFIMCKILPFFFLSAILSAVSAGENDVGRYNIGLAAGYTTGYGFSYRQWFENGYGMQFTCGPYYDKTTSATDANISFGATGLKIINSMQGINSIGYIGAHVHYAYSLDSLYNYDMPIEASVSRSTNFYTGPDLCITPICREVYIWDPPLNRRYTIHSRLCLKVKK